MGSVETHTQFTGSHNEPEAQASSGWEHLCKDFILDTGTKIFVLQRAHTYTHIALHHFLSHVICCGSSYDGVQWPLGEAFTGSVIDEGYHDERPVCSGWGQLHQLTDIQINITGISLYVLNKTDAYLLTVLLCIFGKCRRWGKADPFV